MTVYQAELRLRPHAPPQYLQINVCTGAVLVDGAPVGRLPDQLATHDLTKRLFGLAVLEVYRDSSRKFAFITRGQAAGFIIEQEMDGDADGTNGSVHIRITNIVKSPSAHTLSVDGQSPMDTADDSGDSAESSTISLVLLAHQHLEPILPRHLIDNFSHWLWAEQDLLFFRPCEFDHEDFCSLPACHYVWDLATGRIHVQQEVALGSCQAAAAAGIRRPRLDAGDDANYNGDDGNADAGAAAALEWRPILQDTCVLGHQHLLTRALTKIFDNRLELSSHLLITASGVSGCLVDWLDIVLPRQKLRFGIPGNRVRDQTVQWNPLIRSLDHSGFSLAKDQEIGTLYGLKSAIVLEQGMKMPQHVCGHNIAPPRMLLVPHCPLVQQPYTRAAGEAVARPNGMVLASFHTVTATLSKLYSPPHFAFEVNDVLCQLTARESRLSWLHLAYLHAMTSLCVVPDRFTGMFGAEQALAILQSPRCWSNQGIDKDCRRVLEALCKLTPTRRMYPEFLKVMQTVDYPPYLSPLCALDAYRLASVRLMQDSHLAMAASDADESEASDSLDSFNNDDDDGIIYIQLVDRPRLGDVALLKLTDDELHLHMRGYLRHTPRCGPAHQLDHTYFPADSNSPMSPGVAAALVGSPLTYKHPELHPVKDREELAHRLARMSLSRVGVATTDEDGNIKNQLHLEVQPIFPHFLGKAKTFAALPVVSEDEPTHRRSTREQAKRQALIKQKAATAKLKQLGAAVAVVADKLVAVISADYTKDGKTRKRTVAELCARAVHRFVDVHWPVLVWLAVAIRRLEGLNPGSFPAPSTARQHLAALLSQAAFCLAGVGEDNVAVQELKTLVAVLACEATRFEDVPVPPHSKVPAQPDAEQVAASVITEIGIKSAAEQILKRPFKPVASNCTSRTLLVEQWTEFETMFVNRLHTKLKDLQEQMQEWLAPADHRRVIQSDLCPVFVEARMQGIIDELRRDATEEYKVNIRLRCQDYVRERIGHLTKSKEAFDRDEQQRRREFDAEEAEHRRNGTDFRKTFSARTFGDIDELHALQQVHGNLSNQVTFKPKTSHDAALAALRDGLRQWFMHASWAKFFECLDAALATAPALVVSESACVQGMTAHRALQRALLEDQPHNLHLQWRLSQPQMQEVVPSLQELARHGGDDGGRLLRAFEWASRTTALSQPGLHLDTAMQTATRLYAPTLPSQALQTSLPTSAKPALKDIPPFPLRNFMEDVARGSEGDTCAPTSMAADGDSGTLGSDYFRDLEESWRAHHEAGGDPAATALANVKECWAAASASFGPATTGEATLQAAHLWHRQVPAVLLPLLCTQNEQHSGQQLPGKVPKVPKVSAPLPACCAAVGHAQTNGQSNQPAPTAGNSTPVPSMPCSPTLVLLGGFAVAQIEAQRLRRIALLQYGADTNPVLLAREKNHSPHSNWQPCDHPEFVLFQLENNICMWSVQHDVAARMIHPPENRSSTIQLNMGDGKSSVILPCAAASLADGRQLVRILVLRSLFDTNRYELVWRLGGLLRRRVWIMPCRRDFVFKVGDGQRQLECMQSCMRDRGVVLSVPEHVLSFKLKCLELCDKTHGKAANDWICSLAKELLGVLRWTEQHVRLLLDEADELLHFRYQLTYSMGSQLPVPGGELRWIVAAFVLALVRVFAKDLWDMFGSRNVIECRNIPDSRLDRGDMRFPSVRLIAGAHQDDVDEAYTTLSRWVAAAFLNRDDEHLPFLSEDARWDLQLVRAAFPQMQCRAKPKSDADELMDFLVSPALSEGQAELFAEMSRDQLSDHERDVLLLMRGLLGERILFLALSKRWRVEFGVNTKTEYREMAVPFRGKDEAAERTEYGHADVAIVLTYISYYRSGLTSEQLTRCIESLQERQEEGMLTYKQWISGYESTAAGRADFDASITSLAGINLSDDVQRETKLFPLLRHNTLAIDYYLAMVFAKECKHFERKLSCSAWDLCSQRLRLPVTGFSGTNDLKMLMPRSIKQCDLPALKSTNGKVMAYLLREENNTYQPLQGGAGAPSTDEQILELLAADPTRRVLIDVGALAMENSNRQFARAWLGRVASMDIEAVVYFHDHNNQLVVCTRTGQAVPLRLSAYRNRMDRCLVYLDDTHTRGADLKLPHTTRGVVTLGKGLGRDRLVQACMRMRQLGQGQTLEFWASFEAHLSIRGGRGGGMGVCTVTDVLSWASTNTVRHLQAGHTQWAVKGMVEEVSLAAFRCCEAEAVGGQQKLDLLAAACQLPESLDLAVYGRARVRQTVGEFLEVTRDAHLQRTRAVMRTGWDAVTVEGYLDGLRFAARELIAEADKRVGRQYKVLGSDLDEEQERELEQEQEEEPEKEAPPPKLPVNVCDQGLANLLGLGGHATTERLDELGWVRQLRKAVPRFVAGCKVLVDTLKASPALWGVHLHATDNFMETVSDSQTNDRDRSGMFLRPVLWVLVLRGAGAPSHFVLVSPYEANLLVGMMRGDERKAVAGRCDVVLCPFSALLMREHDGLFDNTALHIHAADWSGADDRFWRNLRRWSKSHRSRYLWSQLLVFAGTLFFADDVGEADHEPEARSYASSLALCCLPHSEGEEQAFNETATSSPVKKAAAQAGLALPEPVIARSFFVPPKHRKSKRLDAQRHLPAAVFDVEPFDAIKAIHALRHLESFLVHSDVSLLLKTGKLPDVHVALGAAGNGGL